MCEMTTTIFDERKLFGHESDRAVKRPKLEANSSELDDDYRSNNGAAFVASSRE